MRKIEFQVEQREAGPGAHSWVAVEVPSGDVVPLPRGGTNASGEDLLGKYPELETFIRDKYRLDLSINYLARIDSLRIEEDGRSVWTFRRRQARVVVHEIPRAAVSIVTNGTGRVP